MGANDFAVIDEDTGNITLITIDSDTTSFNRNLLPASAKISLTGPDSIDLPDDSSGLEGIAYDADDDLFYIVKERTTGSGLMGVYSVNPSDGNTTAVVTNFSQAPSSILDLSDIYFRGDSVFLLSERGSDEELFEYDLVEEEFTGELILEPDVLKNAEGVAFSSDGLELFIVHDENDNNPPRDYRRYRLKDSVADFDNDGSLDADDIDELYDEIFGRPNEVNDYDLTNDGTVNQADVDFLVERMLGTFYGDHDLDGDVDIDDLNTVRNNFGMPGKWADGDFDGDLTIDIDDLNYVRNNFGMSSSSAMAGGPVGEAALEAFLLTEFAGRKDALAAFIAPLVTAGATEKTTTTTFVSAATSVNDDFWLEVLARISAS